MRVALVTGGTRGIGAAISIKLKESGYKVAAIYAGNDEVATKFSKENKIAVFKWSIANYEECIAGIKSVEDELGEIDILVNNAGIALPQDYLDVSSEDWDRTMEINSKGVFLGIRYAIPAMQRAGGGSIVNISSIAGIVGRPLSSPAYAASKGAVRVLTKSTAGRFASENIRCNSVHPGPINTDMIRSVTHSSDPESRVGSIPLGRIGQSIDVAYGVLYLASDESSFVTGIELIIDGGVTGIRE